jgi:hypothetical protein
MGPRTKTSTVEVSASLLTNLAWARLRDLMDDDLSDTNPNGDAISEAEVLLQFMRSVADRSDFLALKLIYDRPELTGNDRR